MSTSENPEASPYPMTFYKYLPAGFAIQAIQNQSLKVGIANQQNDIFDCYPIIQAGEAPNEQEDKLLTEETLEEMSAWYGIVSFCEEPDNLLLWAHYGDSHRGIALGIQFDAGNEPIKVEYLPENKRRTIRKDQIERIADELEQKEEELSNAKHVALFMNAFNVKGPDWEYENESRHFKALECCTKINGLYFAPLATYEISRVILGYRCTVTTEDVWRSFKKRPARVGFEILRAKPHEREFKMQLIPDEVQPKTSWFWQP